MEEFTRGIETQKVVFKDGTKSTVCHCLKNGIGMMYWYWLQLPCKGWALIDIRDLQGEDKIPRDIILTPKILPYISGLIGKVNYEDMIIWLID